MSSFHNRYSCCGNIFPRIQSAFGKEIQGLSFDAWYSGKLCEVNVVNLCF